MVKVALLLGGLLMSSTTLLAQAPGKGHPYEAGLLVDGGLTARFNYYLDETWVAGLDLGLNGNLSVLAFANYNLTEMVEVPFDNQLAVYDAWYMKAGLSIITGGGGTNTGFAFGGGYYMQTKDVPFNFEVEILLGTVNSTHLSVLYTFE